MVFNFDSYYLSFVAINRKGKLVNYSNRNLTPKESNADNFDKIEWTYYNQRPILQFKQAIPEDSKEVSKEDQLVQKFIDSKMGSVCLVLLRQGCSDDRVLSYILKNKPQACSEQVILMKIKSLNNGRNY